MSDKSTTATTSLASAERSRREMLGLAVVGGASAAFLATPARAEAAQVKGRTGAATTYRLTVMGTTDLHGNVFNWDYFKDAEYDDAEHNDIGLAKIATLVKAHARGARAPRSACCSTPATPSRARRWPTTTPRSTRSPAARSTRWPRP